MNDLVYMQRWLNFNASVSCVPKTRSEKIPLFLFNYCLNPVFVFEIISNIISHFI